MIEPGDYIIHSNTWRGIAVTVCQATPSDRHRLHWENFQSDEEAYAFIRKDMETQQFFPNVWIIWDNADPQLYPQAVIQEILK